MTNPSGSADTGDSAAQQAVEWHSQIADSFSAAYQRSPRFIERAELWRGFIDRHLAAGGAVLDAGCGSGEMSLLAAERAARVVAFDGSAQMIEIARERARAAGRDNISFDVANLADIDRFGQGAFDLVMSSSVLEYQDDVASTLAAHVAMLKPGGVLLVSLPNGASLYRAAERAAFAISGRPRYRAFVRYTPRPAAFLDLLRDAGLQTLETATYGSAPGIGGPMRAAGLARWSDTMQLAAARRA